MRLVIDDSDVGDIVMLATFFVTLVVTLVVLFS